MSELLQESAAEKPPYDFLQLALLPSERAVLHERIARRFDEMLLAGLADELAGLRRKYRLDAGLPSMRCVGYRQAWEAQDGLITRREMRERGIFATRQLAKRQITWLGNSFSAESLDCVAPQLSERVVDRVARFLNA
jgi:tRNA dimethylallyltransferase